MAYFGHFYLFVAYLGFGLVWTRWNIFMRQKSLFIFVCCIQELTQKTIEGLDMGKRKTRRQTFIRLHAKNTRTPYHLILSSVACLEAELEANAKNFYHVNIGQEKRIGGMTTLSSAEELLLGISISAFNFFPFYKPLYCI